MTRTGAGVVGRNSVAANGPGQSAAEPPSPERNDEVRLIHRRRRRACAHRIELPSLRSPALIASGIAPFYALPEPMSDATLQAIYIKSAKRGPMQPAQQAMVLEANGIVGNANQGGRRQVTILEEEVWHDAMRLLGGSLEPHARRANLLVRGVRLPNSVGRVLRVGHSRIRILGETKPCPRMDEALPGLKEALRPEWRGGVYGEVLAGGTISVGDTVGWEADPS